MHIHVRMCMHAHTQHHATTHRLLGNNRSRTAIVRADRIPSCASVRAHCLHFLNLLTYRKLDMRLNMYHVWLWILSMMRYKPCFRSHFLNFSDIIKYHFLDMTYYTRINYDLHSLYYERRAVLLLAHICSIFSICSHIVFFGNDFKNTYQLWWGILSMMKDAMCFRRARFLDFIDLLSCIVLCKWDKTHIK